MEASQVVEIALESSRKASIAKLERERADLAELMVKNGAVNGPRLEALLKAQAEEECWLVVDKFHHGDFSWANSVAEAVEHLQDSDYFHASFGSTSLMSNAAEAVRFDTIRTFIRDHRRFLSAL